jgi:LysR family transcriptional regulator, transcriptional activator of nhaA
MINFKHLHYFLIVAKEGSITKASEQLHLTPQTISGQLSVLEDRLGEALFSRTGRNLILTETGRLVLSYADEIFSLGGELEEMVRNLPVERQLVFNVGVADVVPKSIAYRLLAPALKLPESIRIVCKEGELNTLLSDLAVHKLDLIIADEPIPPNINVRGFNHFLGGCGISFFAAKKLTKILKNDFPECLDSAPLLLPGEMNGVRNHLVQWLDDLHIYPRIVGEFDDSALMKAFGQGGTGVFIAPTAIANEVAKQYGVYIIGQTNDVREQFYSISVERKTSHPAIAAINETASGWLSDNK